MGAAANYLMGLVEADGRFDIPWSELLPKQLEAANERLNERVGAIKVLANRAETAGTKAIREVADIVPLLFAHTAYKSYPENWFTQGKWDRMNSWLDTLTTNRVRDVDTKNVKDVDDWIARLATHGHYVAASSGTTGKCSVIPSAKADLDFVRREMPSNFAWSTGIKQSHQYKGFGLAPVAHAARPEAAREALIDGLVTSWRPFSDEVITIGKISKMVELRRSIANGTARPAEIAAFEATAAQRAKAQEDALKKTAEALVASRGDRLLIQGMIATLYQTVELVRAMGYSGKDFHPENALISGGGLKGAKLPPDYREQILGMFNVRPERTFQFYGMQEINATMPGCSAGRYHVPPWTMLLLLDQEGDNLLPVGKGEMEGRAAFFDLSLEGRWAGTITGDKLRVDYGKCACGHQGPHMSKDIVRYSDLPGGDKISCSGTIDAYIRGAA